MCVVISRLVDGGDRRCRIHFQMSLHTVHWQFLYPGSLLKSTIEIRVNALEFDWCSFLMNNESFPSLDYFPRLKWEKNTKKYSQQESSCQDTTFENAKKWNVCAFFFKMWERNNSFHVPLPAIFIILFFCCSISRCPTNSERKLCFRY